MILPFYVWYILSSMAKTARTTRKHQEIIIKKNTHLVLYHAAVCHPRGGMYEYTFWSRRCEQKKNWHVFHFSIGALVCLSAVRPSSNQTHDQEYCNKTRRAQWPRQASSKSKYHRWARSRDGKKLRPQVRATRGKNICGTGISSQQTIHTYRWYTAEGIAIFIHGRQSIAGGCEFSRTTKIYRMLDDTPTPCPRSPVWPPQKKTATENIDKNHFHLELAKKPQTMNLNLTETALTAAHTQKKNAKSWNITGHTCWGYNRVPAAHTNPK